MIQNKKTLKQLLQDLLYNSDIQVGGYITISDIEVTRFDNKKLNLNVYSDLLYEPDNYSIHLIIVNTIIIPLLRYFGIKPTIVLNLYDNINYHTSFYLNPYEYSL